MEDASLVLEALCGSVPAFTAIFDGHVAQVHDVALALLRDRTAALEVVNATFNEASRHLKGLKEPARLGVWLVAVTRFEAALVAKAEAGPDRRPTGQDHLAERAHLTGLVWEATADLPLQERALLDLLLRQGLDGQDLADALGIGVEEVAQMRSGMESLEKGLAGYIMMRMKDRRCPDLPLVLRGWDGRFTPLIATHVAAHVDACRVCHETTTALPSPIALYASAPQAPLPGPGAGEPAAAGGA